MKRLLLLCLFSIACNASELFLPALPATAEAYTPPAIYQEWYQIAKVCVASVDEIRHDIGSAAGAYWFVVSDSAWQSDRHGAYDKYHNAFWIAERQINSQYTINHELIHSFGYSNAYHERQPFTACDL